MKETLKKILPRAVLNIYHNLLSLLAALWYRRPSEEIIVIGVTGTKGKTTVTHLIAKILEEAGFKVGMTSTVAFKIGGQEWLNPLKMTMPGRFLLQKLLRRMVSVGCEYAVVESSSEGVIQFRHRHINFDAMVFTNLAPEHLERHGGFEGYKRAKLELFRHLAESRRKIINGKSIPKIIVANGLDEYAPEFLNFDVEKKAVFFSAAKNSDFGEKIASFEARDARSDFSGISFKVGSASFSSPLPGRFNIENCLAAVATASMLGIKSEPAVSALAKVKLVPGRMEAIAEGQDFSVIVDYAHEPKSLAALYETVKDWPKGRQIQVFGSAGGGRDKSKRGTLGEMAARACDIVVVTNEDAFDENPEEIIRQISDGALKAGKVLGKDLFTIVDRREGIKKALTAAQKGDLVLVTGKGTEQKMVLGGGKSIKWDDREVVREELKNLLQGDSGVVRNSDQRV